MQIKRLEERLDVPLFERTPAGVQLTAAGDRLLDYARRILALNTEAVGHLRQRQADSVVRLGVMDDYGTKVIPPLLAHFTANHPTVRIEIETGLTCTMPARLGEAYDLVIAMHPEGRRHGELLRREQAVWAAAASYSVARQDLLPVALYPEGCLFRRWAAEGLDRAGRPWRLAFVSRTLAAVESIAVQGLAVTVVKSGALPASLRALSEATACRRCRRPRSACIGRAICRAPARCWRITCSAISRNLSPCDRATRNSETDNP